jgi:hypothetical protein
MACSRQYTSIQEVKSVITSPSGGQMLLDKGFTNITGLAWSGRGKVRRWMCPPTAGATGSPRAWKARCCPSA